MKRNRIVWGVLGLLWGGFFLWYTNIRGPLTEAEIARIMQQFESGRRDQGAPAPEALAALRHFLETDTGDDFVMLNLIEMNEPRPATVGEERRASPAEALDRYMAYMWPALLARACHPVFNGSAAAPALDVWGIDDAGAWSSGALMRYRSRRDMMEIAGSATFAGSHAFKITAMAKTIAVPLDPWMTLGDPRLLLALILAPLGLLLTRPRPRLRT